MNINPIKLFLLLYILNTSFGFASNTVKKDTILKPKEIVDALLLNENLDWSFRLLGNFKQQQFRIKNGTNKLFYKPNNPFGVGFGIANQKLVIDILFNIKTEEKNLQTNKFAAEGATIYKQNYFGFVLENVHGYEITNNINNHEEFRKNLSLFTLGLDYLYLLSSDRFSVRMMKSGLTNLTKSTITLGVGGFFVTNKLSADGTILPSSMNPYFGDETNITHFSAYGVGILGGIAAHIKLPANFFMSFSAFPGLGLEHKKVKTTFNTYTPSDLWLYKLNLFAGLGYSGKKYYLHFNFATNFYATDLDFDNKGLLAITKSKLIFGYNIGKINLKPKKKKAY